MIAGVFETDRGQTMTDGRRGGAVLSIVDGGAFRTHSSTNSLAAPPASILVKVRAYWKIDGEI
jgi:hypothetical protein